MISRFCGKEQLKVCPLLAQWREKMPPVARNFTEVTMIEPKRKKKSGRKKKQGIDLTNAPVKRKAVKAARRVMASQAGDVAALHGAEAELLDPPVYEVARRGILAEPSRSTEF